MSNCAGSSSVSLLRRPDIRIAERERLREGARQIRNIYARAASSIEAAALATARFESGAADFLTVSDAEGTALKSEDQLARGETQTATALLAMYKALGGGFRPDNRLTARK